MKVQQQLFMIVLDNAIKFTGKAEDGSVHPVRVSFIKGVVTVTNFGSEIALEDIPYIFDRFFKSYNESNKQGTGLGLAIAKQIASRHGIGITVTSKSKLNLPSPL